jgi:hypothetical protein
MVGIRGGQHVGGFVQRGRGLGGAWGQAWQVTLRRWGIYIFWRAGASQTIGRGLFTGFLV